MADSTPTPVHVVYYKLVHQQTVPCTRKEALYQLQHNDRRLRRSLVNGCMVITSFGVINQAGPNEAPLLFDTLITSDDGAGARLWRSTTYAEAMARHQWAVEKVQRSEHHLEPLFRDRAKP